MQATDELTAGVGVGRPNLAVAGEEASEMVPDDLRDEEHELLDRDQVLIFLIGTFNDLHASNASTLGAARTILTIVVNNCDLLDKKYSSDKDSDSNVTQLFEEYPWLVSLVQDCCENRTARKLRLLKILRKPAVTPSLDDTEEEKQMVLESWDLQYRGNATDVLLNIISDYLKTKRTNYAPLASIINSSGTGKSRMVDELAKTIISVPMCLRDKDSTGFPPADGSLRDWFAELPKSGKEETEKKLHGFLHSLLEVTLQRLKEIEASQDGLEKLKVARKTWTVDDMLAGKYKPSEETERKNAAAFFVRRQERLASAFRHLMTHGQAFGSANDYRKKFYKDVIDGARTFTSGSRRVHEQGDSDDGPSPESKQRGRSAVGTSNTSPSIKSSPVRYRNASNGDIAQVVTRLNDFIDPARVWGAPAGKKTDIRRPFLILSFDESHRLTESDKEDGWSVFSELRRALRQAADVPIFSLFLATGGKFRRFSPTLPSDPSSRISRKKYSVLPPITETGFDVLMPVACEGVVTLTEVISLNWICHLGRPLFGSLYDFAPNNLARTNIHNFAKQKILGGNITVPEAMKKWEKEITPEPGNWVLASVAIRFALEFNPTTEFHRDAVLTLVERHMRLCISATSGFEALSTTSSSEPFLAEAAQEILSDIGQSPVKHLAGRLDQPFIDRGNRGELTALLILMAARDKAAGITGTRDIPLCDFLEALMPDFAYAQLKEALPFQNRTEAEKQSFGDAFKDSRLWFNHVIRIHDTAMLSSHELWKFMTRGAMIMCQSQQVAVDIVIPFCISGDVLSRKTVSAIFIQVKNDKRIGPAHDPILFHAINPFSLKVYKDDETPLPCIRMVFALASKEPAMHIAKPSDRDSRHGKPFTAYDIWFSGIWPETFPIIGNEREEYKLILQRSMPDPKAAYADSDPDTDSQVKQARENIRRNLTPLCSTESAHHSKYRKLEEIAAQ
ncbi:hypothetical protein BC834DRAFT_975730 [Gloeopeniophorella convolvens]|nr:hypothetical protein BC834DRAFT_975730 [Gloeopeniophorella convolvens]